MPRATKSRLFSLLSKPTELFFECTGAGAAVPVLVTGKHKGIASIAWAATGKITLTLDDAWAGELIEVRVTPQHTAVDTVRHATIDSANNDLSAKTVALLMADAGGAAADMTDTVVYKVTLRINAARKLFY